MFALVAKDIEAIESFDYSDLYAAKTLLLRLGETAFIAVLKDSCGAWNVMGDFVKRLTGRLSPLQLRELTARAASVYLHLEDLPQFSSSFEADPPRYAILGEHPEQVKLKAIDPAVYGPLLELECGELVDKLNSAKASDIREAMRAGTWTFLFNQAGEFDSRSMDLKDPADAKAQLPTTS